MKLHKPKVTKKIALVSSVIVLGLIGGVSAEMANQKPVGADTSPLVTEVDQQNDKLNNHEARISNLETDTRTLQANTNTQPSTNKVAVPTVRAANTTASASQTASLPTETVAPVTVTAFREIVIDADTSDCEYTYSDGSTDQFKWKSTNQQGAWVQDGGMGPGHWQKTINYSNFCDKRAIGTLKT
jgi:hypothetical protein